MMSTFAALFSGQGSQYPGMGKALIEQFPAARRIYECAGDILGFNVAKLSVYGNEQELARTAMAQPAIFTLSAAAATVAKDYLPAPSAVAGHSLGEFAALWYAGAYSLEDGLRIIKARAAAMDTVCTPGTMYAITGGNADEVRAACEQVDGFVVPVNFNLPTQTVISGDIDAVAKAAEQLAAAGKKATRLSVSAAFHTQRMREAAEQLKQELGNIQFHPTTLDFYSNLTGGKHTITDYPAYFAEHMVSPVRFVQQMQAMAKDGIEICVEFGPKKTVCTLAKKNIRTFQVANVEDIPTLEKAQNLF